MIAHNIEMTPVSEAKLRLRAYFEKHSREPRGGEVQWQKQLTALDPELHLRWSYRQKCWIIVYDHHGCISIVRSLKPGESFGCCLKNLEHNAHLSVRRLREMHKNEREGQDAHVDKLIENAGEQAGRDLHKMSKRVLTTDSVDDCKY